MFAIARGRFATAAMMIRVARIAPARGGAPVAASVVGAGLGAAGWAGVVMRVPSRAGLVAERPVRAAVRQGPGPAASSGLGDPLAGRVAPSDTVRGLASARLHADYAG